MITVETTDATVRVTIPKSEVPTDRLNWFVDSLRLESMAHRLQACMKNTFSISPNVGWGITTGAT